jgi:hypothetical protein
MSHFSVLVVGANVAEQLQPYHEYECTGIEDQYVVDVDLTAEALAAFNTSTTNRLRSPDGKLHSLFTEAGNYREEFWATSPDVFRNRTLIVPEGWQEVDVPTRDHEPASTWIAECYGLKILAAGQAKGKEHRFGFVSVDDNGNVLKVIDRTNPNKKWDGWQVGGRYSSRLLLKSGERVDEARRGDIDVEGMRNAAGKLAASNWDHAHAIIRGRRFRTWKEIRAGNIGDLAMDRDVYHSQAVISDWSHARPLDDIDQYLCSREDFIQTARNGAIKQFAYVKDSQWYERGRMGWFACVSDEMDPAEWARQFDQMFDALPPDTQLTIVDCHI